MYLKFIKGFLIIVCLLLNLVYCYGSNESLETYEHLKNSLADTLKDKKFNDQVREIFMDTFEAVYKNYYDYECTNIGLPKVQVYLRNNFIDLLKYNIEYVNVCDRNSEQGRSFLEKIGAAYYMPGLRYISIVPPDKNDTKAYNAYLAAVLHEVTHSNQENIAFSRDSFLGVILTEGAATFNQRFAVKASSNIFLYDSIENPESGMAVYTKVPDELGYSFYENFYCKLQMLVGYDEMVKLQKGEGIQTLITSINSRYGNGTGERILKDMESSFFMLKETKEIRNTKTRFDAIVNLEKDILKCIEIDINNLKNKDDTVKYFNVYRNYKNRYLFSYIRSSNLKEDHTEEVFNIKNLDDIMAKKVIEFKALSANVDLKIIKLLLFSDSYKIDKDLHIPYNLKTSKFTHDCDIKDSNIVLFDSDDKSALISIGKDGVIEIKSNEKDFNKKDNIFNYITMRENYIRLPDTGEVRLSLPFLAR
ncbi:MAG: hypothetical protein FWC47_11260 [Oscillospiraceae bacterium]|nr:hypothetical protein [Oscillospiraceae bacterium]